MGEERCLEEVGFMEVGRVLRERLKEMEEHRRVGRFRKVEKRPPGQRGGKEGAGGEGEVEDRPRCCKSRGRKEGAGAEGEGTRRKNRGGEKEGRPEWARVWPKLGSRRKRQGLPRAK